MNPITIIVVDDHPLFRQGVADTLALETDFSVVGQAASGEEGLDLIRSLQPMVAVVDVNLPGMNGQQVTRQVMNERLATRVILLTAYDDSEQKIHALRSGAAAYCTKDVEPPRLVEVVRRVVGEHLPVKDSETEEGASELWAGEPSEEIMAMFLEQSEGAQALSIREMEVLTYVTRGLSNKEIATLLGISHQTVKNHVTAILRKLGVEDRTQAAIYALRRGWVRLHEQNPGTEE